MNRTSGNARAALVGMTTAFLLGFKRNRGGLWLSG